MKTYVEEANVGKCKIKSRFYALNDQDAMEFSKQHQKILEEHYGYAHVMRLTELRPFLPNRVISLA